MTAIIQELFIQMYLLTVQFFTVAKTPIILAIVDLNLIKIKLNCQIYFK
jgi:hypothetical protein